MKCAVEFTTIKPGKLFHNVGEGIQSAIRSNKT
jgi:hypothetical protein